MATGTPWDENEVEVEVERPSILKQVVYLDELDDGRCKASSWRSNATLPRKPTYEHHFGVAGYNRCIGSEGHANQYHKDEWGFVFHIAPDGAFRVIREEGSRS